MDSTEPIRRALVQAINQEVPHERTAAEERFGGQVWNTQDLTTGFDVLGFLAPFVRVRRKSDGRCGLMEFAHNPRWYFHFTEEK